MKKLIISIMILINLLILNACSNEEKENTPNDDNKVAIQYNDDYIEYENKLEILEKETLYLIQGRNYVIGKVHYKDVSKEKTAVKGYDYINDRKYQLSLKDKFVLEKDKPINKYDINLDETLILDSVNEQYTKDYPEGSLVLAIKNEEYIINHPYTLYKVNDVKDAENKLNEIIIQKKKQIVKLNHKLDKFKAIHNH